MWQLGAPLGLGFWPNSIPVESALAGEEVTVNTDDLLGLRQVALSGQITNVNVGIVSPVVVGTIQVALTGQNITVNVDTLLSVHQVSVAGQEVNANNGNLLALREILLTENIVNVFSEALGLGIGTGITGESIYVEEGILTTVHDVAIVGQAVSVLNGNVTANIALKEIEISGAEVSTATGILAASRSLGLIGESVDSYSSALIQGEIVRIDTGIVLVRNTGTPYLPLYLNELPIVQASFNDRLVIELHFNGEQIWP